MFGRCESAVFLLIDADVLIWLPRGRHSAKEAVADMPGRGTLHNHLHGTARVPSPLPLRPVQPIGEADAGQKTHAQLAPVVAVEVDFGQ